MSIKMIKIKETKKEMFECPACHGYGWIHVYSLLVENECPLCRGTGKITNKQHKIINKKNI
jgi:DnaJ-class molecular chaperone